MSNSAVDVAHFKCVLGTAGRPHVIVLTCTRESCRRVVLSMQPRRSLLDLV